MVLYRECEITATYGLKYAWTAPDYDVDYQGDPLQPVASGGHGEGDMYDCVSQIDEYMDAGEHRDSGVDK